MTKLQIGAVSAAAVTQRSQNDECLTQQIEQLLHQHFIGAEIVVESSDQVHFTAQVRAKEFKGLSRVAQQQAVYAALGNLISSGIVHALSLKTQVLE